MVGHCRCDGRKPIVERSTKYDVPYIFRNRTKRASQNRSNRNDTMRIERDIASESDSTQKTEFLNIAPEWTFLVSHESGFKYDSISRKNTLIHAELTELRMPQVTPQNHTRAQKAPGCKVG